jgi:oxygen-independent coproporphyrinogen-3 oxidase
MLRENEYSHYEVSNFAKKGFESKHNTSYWSGKPYLGVGPSAHSFDGISTRRWNVSNNTVYLKKIYDNEKYFESELLNSSERYNETVMTSLRTAKGIDTDQVKALFGIDIKKEFSQEISEYQSVGWLISEAKGIRLTEEGFFRGDTIASDFFKVEEK